MPYSIMVWLMSPGEQSHEAGAIEASADRGKSPGASSGVNVPPAFTRLTYGLYENRDLADVALVEIENKLQHNVPLRVARGDQHFLIPAGRVHYIVCEEVVRPKDQ